MVNVRRGVIDMGWESGGQSPSCGVAVPFNSRAPTGEEMLDCCPSDTEGGILRDDDATESISSNKTSMERTIATFCNDGGCTRVIDSYVEWIWPLRICDIASALGCVCAPTFP